MFNFPTAEMWIWSLSIFRSLSKHTFGLSSHSNQFTSFSTFSHSSLTFHSLSNLISNLPIYNIFSKQFSSCIVSSALSLSVVTKDTSKLRQFPSLEFGSKQNTSSDLVLWRLFWVVGRSLVLSSISSGTWNLLKTLRKTDFYLVEGATANTYEAHLWR